MAANMMMDVLRKMQRDLNEQKDYMRNLHVMHRNINEKFNLMTEKFDQQQGTMERLERQVKKNITLLFGNDESDIFKENASFIPHFEHNDSLKQPEKCIESNEANQLQTLNKETALTEETEWNAEDDNKKNYDSKKPDNELNEDGQEFTVITNELREIKDLISDFVKTGKALVKETISSVHNLESQKSPTCFNTEQICQPNGDMKQIMSEISEMKELFKEMSATRNISANKMAAPIEKNNIQTVQISPAYFNTDQISKLNTELKKITETYQASNIFPNIKVVPDTSLSDEHPVMKALCAGVFYEAKNNTLAQYKERYGIKLGTSGFKRSNVRYLLTEYPNLTLYEVVKEGLRSTNEWSELSKIYNFTRHFFEPRKIWSMEAVQIAPIYFDADQITKLNHELQQITKKYVDTNIFPIIQVVPNPTNFDNHPVIKALSQGISGSGTSGYSKFINFDTNGFQKSSVEQILRTNPHVTVYNFVRQRLESLGMHDNMTNFKYSIKLESHGRI